MAYTWFIGTNQASQIVTTYPVVSIAQNGSGAAATSTQVFDQYGNLLWTLDPRGFINQRIFDATIGAVTESVQDFNTTTHPGIAPAGWTTPAGGGLHLITDTSYDAQGRPIQVLGPSHPVDGNTVRTASWTVYRDDLDQVWNAQGYASGTGPSYTYTLVNPVSITQLDDDCRTIGRISATRGTTVESAGALSASDSYPQSSWVRWSTTTYDDEGGVASTQVYFNIPTSGAGAAGINFDQTVLGYDSMDRQNWIVSPGGTITRTVFDVRNNAVQTWVGTNDEGATDADPTGGGAAGNNMVLVSQNQFDGGFASGDGNLTQTLRPVDDNPDNDRITTFAYDWRNRQTNMDGEENQHFVYMLDNLDRITLTQQFDQSGPTAVLVGQTAMLYDDRGQTYQTVQYAVSGGAVGTALTSNTWYDAAGNTIKNLPAGSNAFTKTMIDGAGRATASYYGYYTGGGSEPYSQVGQVTSSNLIIEQSLMTFDAAGNLIEVDRYQRFDPGNTTGAGGVLNGPAGPDPKARVTYVAAWFDGIGRQKAVADYGTNGNVALTRPATAPASSSTVLVSQVVFNIRGEAFQTIDPMGTVTQTTFDNANRRIQLIENYVSGGTATDQNRTTTWAYNADDNVIAITAYNAVTGNQTTAFSFGATAPASGLSTNDLLHAVTYPDGGIVSHEYNRQSQRTTTTDQNGTVHQFSFDMLGRQTTDNVAVLGVGVDGAVAAIQTAYEVRNLVTTISSLDSSGNVVNQVQRVYNGFRQLTGEYQEHGGAVNTASTPLVQYGFADGSANTIRPTSLTYPNGNVLALGYGTAGGIDDNLSRIDSLNWQGTQVCAYTFLGAGTFVRADYVQRKVRYDLITGSGANPYAGFDQFARIISCLWYKYSGTAGAVDQFNCGYDLASNRLWRQNVVAGSLGQNFDELYAYDGLYQLMDMQRGELNGSQTAIVSGTLAFHETWGLDQTGNWGSYTQDATGSGTPTLAQTRDGNRVNEITDISNTTGPGWITPQYDAAGNMTRLPQPSNPSAGYCAIWDAWNRLVELSDAGSVVAQFSYDALTRRVSAVYPTETSHFYYSANWQILEERLGTSPDAAEPDRQFVWGLRYIDDLILRDRSVSGILDERLYAVQDANWNVTAIISTSGAVQERNAYSAYGVVTSLSAGFNSGSETTFEWDEFYCGYRIECAVGLYMVRRRWFGQVLGCWLSNDPMQTAQDRSRSQYARSRPITYTDPYGLRELSQNETANVLRDVGKALDNLVGQKQISKNVRDLRFEIVKAALNSTMGFSTSEAPNSMYWEFGSDDEYHIRQGHVADAAHDRVYNRGNTGCRKAAQTLFLEGLSQLAAMRGRTAELEKCVGGKSLSQLYPRGVTNSFEEFAGQKVNPKDFIPGDRVWMQNHRFSPHHDAERLEGSNVVFIGKISSDYYFAHVDRDVESLNQLRQTVQGYSGAAWRDPNILHYTFKERYLPRVPPCVLDDSGK